MTQSVINYLAVLTLISNFSVGLILLRWTNAKKILGDRAIFLAFTVALTATLGSLYLSEIAHFTPCKLCWLQRIFMYPLVIILGTALYKKRQDVAVYVLPLSLVGGLISSYHYYLQMNPQPLAPCSDIGFSVSCSDRFVTSYGYITIPWMALSAFVLIGLLMLISLKKK